MGALWKAYAKDLIPLWGASSSTNRSTPFNKSVNVSKVQKVQSYALYRNRSSISWKEKPATRS